MTLIFNKIGYTINGKTVLQNVSGVAYPGKLLAIMGGSGAGKSTCLDILSGKAKRGRIDGSITVNGNHFPRLSTQSRICRSRRVLNGDFDCSREFNIFRYASSSGPYTKQD